MAEVVVAGVGLDQVPARITSGAVNSFEHHAGQKTNIEGIDLHSF